MDALRQRLGGGKAPGAVGRHLDFGQQFTVVVNGDGATHFSGAGQLGLVGINKCPGGDDPLRGALVVDYLHGRRVRREGINGDREHRRLRTDVTGRVGGGGGQLVEAIAQIGGGGEGPAAVGGDHDGADGDAIVIDRDLRSRFTAAGEGRARIVGGLIVGERPGNAANVVIGDDNRGGIRRGGVGGGNGGLRADVARAVRRRCGQCLAVGVRRAQLDGELTVAIGDGFADDVAVGIGDGDAAVGFGVTQQLSGIRRETQVGRGVGWGGILRGRARIHAIVTATPAAAAPGGQRNTARGSQSA
ncbi:hypothetical protein D3C75_754820 [compost metagenome]